MVLRKFALLVPIFLLFWGLSYAPFWNPDEGRYVAASYEMAFGFGPNSATQKPTDWLIPHLNTLTRLNKPPLVYWLTSANFQIFGPSEWSARLVPTSASLLILVLLYIWASRALGRRAGLGAALVWSTAVFPAAMGRTANTDMLLCAAMTLLAFGVFWALEEKKPLLYGSIAGVGIGLALLAKGPVGVALPLLVIFLYLSVTRAWKRVPWGAAALALLLGLGIGLPWFLLVEAQQDGFLRRFLLSENLSRFAGGEKFHRPTSPLFYLPVLLGGLLPWTPFLIPALSKWRESTDLATRTKTFALLWGVVICLFFSPSKTKLISYILPAFPMFCLLIGAAIGRWERAPRWAKNAGIAGALVWSLALVVAISAIPKKDKVTREWRLAPGVLLDDRIWPRENGVPWVWGIASLMAASGAALLIGARYNTGRAMLVAGGAGAAGNLVMLLAIAGKIAPYEDGSGVVTALAPRLKADDNVVGYRSFLPTTIYYSQRPVTFFHFINKSGLIPAEVRDSPYFFEKGTHDEGKLLEWQKKNPGRTFLITSAFLDWKLRPYYHYWGRTNDFFLYSNAPKPNDFVLENVAPRRVQSRDVQDKSLPENQNRD